MPNGGIQPVGDAAVVGMGDTAQGIALSLALGGFKVVLVGAPREKLRRTVDGVRIALGILQEQGMVDRWTAERTRQHLIPSTSVAGAMDEVGFAVEATAGDLEVKRGMLAELDRHCPTRAVLASTGSSFSVSQLATSIGRPDRVVVTKWGDPPHVAPRVDVLTGPETSDATVDWVREVFEYIGKETVFITAR